MLVKCAHISFSSHSSLHAGPNRLLRIFTCLHPVPHQHTKRIYSRATYRYMRSFSRWIEFSIYFSLRFFFVCFLSDSSGQSSTKAIFAECNGKVCAECPSIHMRNFSIYEFAKLIKQTPRKKKQLNGMFASILLTQNYNSRKYLFLHLFKRPDVVRIVWWRIVDDIFPLADTSVCAVDAQMCFSGFATWNICAEKLSLYHFWVSSFTVFSFGRPFIGISISHEEKTMRETFHDFDNNRIYSGRKAADACTAVLTLQAYECGY